MTWGALQLVVGFWGNSVGGHGLDTVLYLAGDPEEVTSIRGTLDTLNPAHRGTPRTCTSSRTRRSAAR